MSSEGCLYVVMVGQIPSIKNVCRPVIITSPHYRIDPVYIDRDSITGLEEPAWPFTSPTSADI